MDQTADLLKDLENHILALRQENQKLLQEKQALNKRLQELENEHNHQLAEINRKETDLKKLKLSLALNGNEDYKKLMKLKINQLIKEVDHCMAQIKVQSF